MTTVPEIFLQCQIYRQKEEKERSLENDPRPKRSRVSWIRIRGSNSILASRVSRHASLSLLSRISRYLPPSRTDHPLSLFFACCLFFLPAHTDSLTRWKQKEQLVWAENEREKEKERVWRKASDSRNERMEGPEEKRKKGPFSFPCVSVLLSSAVPKESFVSGAFKEGTKTPNIRR